MRYAGWIIIAVISLIPVFLWYFLGPGPEAFKDYGTVTHAIGELAGLVAMTMFALTFVLSTRIPAIEDYFGGMDKVYIAHGILGSSALMLILAHPVFLVLRFVPDNLRQAAIYLLPSAYWSVNFGIIAMIGFIVLISITLFMRTLKYQYWKFTHEFLGLVFFLAVLHIFLVPFDATADNVFAGYYFYAIAVSAIGLGAFAYSLVIKNRLFKAASYHIERIEQKGPGTSAITMVPDHKPISYKSGQFIFVRFYNEKVSRESHPFTIASKSNEYGIKIVVKALGDYTSRLAHLKVGDKVSVEGPFGRFNFHRKDLRNQVWLAGGIGITPFLGMAEDMRDGHFSDIDVVLYYSVREKEDLIGMEELKAIEKEMKNFRVVPWVSREKGRLSVSELGPLEGKDFFLCGPAAFKNSLTQNLLQKGVKDQHIHTEEFDFK